MEPGTDSRTRLSPFCAHLSSKKLRFAPRPPQTERDVLDGSNNCWCRLTQMTVGADDGIVDPEDCREGRKCFVPWGS